MFRFLTHFELIFVYKLNIQLHSFSCGYLVFLTPFVEETILSPLYIPDGFVKYIPCKVFIQMSWHSD